MRTKTSGIYCIENIKNGKKYIGRAKDIKTRWRGHKSHLNRNIHQNQYLQRAWNKDGKESFKFWIIQEIPTQDYENFKILEIYWIIFYDTYSRDNGYNLTFGGDGGIGMHLSEDAKMKISLANSGENNILFGKHQTNETKAKISKTLLDKNIKFSDERRKEMSDIRMGVPRSDEICKSIGNGRRGLKLNNVGSSDYVGVSKYDDRYTAHISFENTSYWLGSFNSENEAAEAYNKKAIELMGDSAKLNIIKDSDNKIMHSIQYLENKTNGSSKYYGVSKIEDDEWSARIGLDGRLFHIGTYATEVEAAIAFNETALDIHGFKARINIIPQEEIDALWEME
jgi:group I intron endonuclease